MQLKYINYSVRPIYYDFRHTFVPYDSRHDGAGCVLPGISGTAMSGSQVHHPHAVTFLVTSSQLQETMPCALCTQADSPEGSAGLRGVRRAPRRGRPRTAWTDNIKTWTGLNVEESVRMTEDRDKRRKYVRGVAKPRIARTAKEQNRTKPRNCHISRSCCCWPPPRSDSTTVRTSSPALRDCLTTATATTSPANQWAGLCATERSPSHYSRLQRRITARLQHIQRT